MFEGTYTWAIRMSYGYLRKHKILLELETLFWDMVKSLSQVQQVSTVQANLYCQDQSDQFKNTFGCKKKIYTTSQLRSKKWANIKSCSKKKKSQDKRPTVLHKIDYSFQFCGWLTGQCLRRRNDSLHTLTSNNSLPLTEHTPHNARHQQTVTTSPYDLDVLKVCTCML